MGFNLQIKVSFWIPVNEKKSDICVFISLSLGVYTYLLLWWYCCYLLYTMFKLTKKQLELIKSYSNHRWHYNYHRICCFKNWFNMNMCMCMCVCFVVVVCRQFDPFFHLKIRNDNIYKTRKRNESDSYQNNILSRIHTQTYIQTMYISSK